MKRSLERRDFLRTAGVAAAASLCASAIPGSASQTAPDVAKTPRLLPGCAAYSYRKYLEKGPMTMEDFILKGVELGLSGVDMTGYYWKSTDPGYIAGLRQAGFKNGMPFSGVAIGASMVESDASKRAQVLGEIKKWVDATDLLGASHLRIFAGKLPPGATSNQGIEWSVEIMKAASDYSGKKGITLGLEDHAGITQTADAILEIIHRVDSPYAGINLDITHFLPMSTAYAQIEACIPYATQTHIRDVFDDGSPLDLERVFGLFARHGYKGYMSAEYEGKEDPLTGVPRLIEKIKGLCKKYSSV